MGSLSQSFEQTPIDRLSVPQEILDLESRERTNLFPWRGQFSPCLVEALLSKYASADHRVFDPFAGVGTTLFEASRKQLASSGTEINPAAIAMATTVLFVPLSHSERIEVVDASELVLGETLKRGLPLFSNDVESTSSRLVDLIGTIASPLERSLLINTLVRAMKSSAEITARSLHQAFRQHSNIVMALPTSKQECAVVQADARRTGLDTGSVDLVITSPPYINVFNYHQNNRPAMELLGCDVLAVAKSEFGSNRKHRGNRLLTVIQYCLDMYTTLVELKRVMKSTGRAIIVVGRESNVRGLAFRNGSLVASVAAIAGFRLDLRQERKFKNMFGELIYEDILHLVPSKQSGKGSARAVGVRALEEQLAGTLEPSVRQDVLGAIEGANGVSESPLFESGSSPNGALAHLSPSSPEPQPLLST